MSFVSKGIGLAKKVKHHFQDEIKARTPVYISPVRRIERVKTTKRICAMTFDDGPYRLAPSHGDYAQPLTVSILETMARHGAHGTFDVVGDTSANYPDKCGKPGTAMWGGRQYDHYPDFNRDSDGGAMNCPELIERILSGGHEISNHGYAHIIFGPKPLIYGSRKYLGTLDKVRSDLNRLHQLMLDKYGYEMKLARPPHYVDKIENGLTSYDAYALMGYQYMASSFDGAGWLALSSYEADVAAMWQPIQRSLEVNPDALCGQIIFQKDGCNMLRRTPVHDGLERQLQILDQYDYKVVSVSELMAVCPFEDCGENDPAFSWAKTILDRGGCPAFRDNTLRLDQPVTRGELAMMVFGWPAARVRTDRLTHGGKAYFEDVPATHPYGAAIQLAVEAGCFSSTSKLRPDDVLTVSELHQFLAAKYGEMGDLPETVTRADIFRILAARM
jgi:peptidoglycan/xylan/chitin deacetylase (PgdA/CDA1 family)